MVHYRLRTPHALLGRVVVVTLLILIPIIGMPVIMVRSWLFGSAVCTPSGLPVACCYLLLPFPITFTHLLGSIYHPSYAREVARDACLALLLATFAIMLLGRLPVDEYSPVSSDLWNRMLVRLPSRTLACLAIYILAVCFYLLLIRCQRKRSLLSSFVRYHLASTGLAGAFFVGGCQLLRIERWDMGCATLYLFLMGSSITSFVYLVVLLTTFMARQTHARMSLPSTPTYWGLVVGFWTFLLLSNLLVGKWVALGPYTVTVALFTYPFTFLFTDLIAELYGQRAARFAVSGGLAATLCMILCLLVVRFFLWWLGSVHYVHFVCFFSLTPPMVIASIVAYIFSQWCDLHLFAWVGKCTKGRHLWLRNNLATCASQLLDSFLFATTAWVLCFFLAPASSALVLPWKTWATLSWNEYCCKVVLALLDTPLLYLGVYLLKRQR